MRILSSATTANGFADNGFPDWRRLIRTNWITAWRDGNFPWLSNIPVSYRIIMLLAVALTAALVFTAVSITGERSISKAIIDDVAYRRMGELTADLRAESLTLQMIEEQFLRTRDASQVAAYHRSMANMSGYIGELATLSVAIPVADDIAGLKQELQAIDQCFQTVADTESRLGLTEESGLRGSLFASVKTMEDELKVWPNLDALWNKMLGMRQAEKDFMLYGGDEYLGKHRKFAMEFDLKIDSSGMPAATADQFRKLLTRYTGDMAAFAEASTALKQQTDDLRAHVDVLHPKLNRLFTFAREGSQKASLAQQERRSAILQQNALTGILAIAAFCLFSLILSQSITAPLRLIERTMRRLVHGESITAIPGIQRRDEIGDMARALSVFKENALAMVTLQKEHQALMLSADAEKHAAMAALADRFEGTVQAIVRTVHQGTQTIAQIARDAAARTGVRTELGDSLTVAEAAAKAHDSVTIAHTATDDLSSSIHQVVRLIDEAAGVAKNGTRDLDQADRQVVELSDATEQIGSVLSLINTIAGKTNLLALNATIEAARAGEAGRGFAVVANEVKHLSDQTAQATSRIEEQITGIRLVAADTAQTIGIIGATLRRMAEITETIRQSMQQQAGATDRIDTCMRTVSADSQTVAEGVIEVTQAAARSCSSAIRVLWAATELSVPSERLKKEIDVFLGSIRNS